MRCTVVAVLAAAAFVNGGSSAPARHHVAGHSERLAARARRGDNLARTKLLEEHMGLVRSIAFRYRDLGLPADDLVQEGAIGLLAAVDDYDPSRGASFSTYAFWRVRAAVTHSVTARGQLVRLPRSILEHRREVVRVRERLTSTGPEPTVTELAEATGLSPADVGAALAVAGVASLDQPDRDGTALGDRVAADAAGAPETVLVSAEELRLVRGAVSGLRGRKRLIVSRHFGLAGEPETLTTIADDLHLSPERTRSLKDEALRELACELGPGVGL